MKKIFIGLFIITTLAFSNEKQDKKALIIGKKELYRQKLNDVNTNGWEASVLYDEKKEDSKFVFVITNGFGETYAIFFDNEGNAPDGKEYKKCGSLSIEELIDYWQLSNEDIKLKEIKIK